MVTRNRIILFLIACGVNTLLLTAQTKFLTVDELFQKGIENSLKVQSSQINVTIAKENEGTAKNSRLPCIGISVVGGYLYDPTIFEGTGLTNPTRTGIPNWLQNYDVDLVQPLYYGGKIKSSIEKAGLQKEIALLNVKRNESDVKLLLIGRYIGLFRLYKEKDVLNENIIDAKQRLHDMREMKKEGMITENDLIRSELELTNYELALRETDDNIEIISQQLDVALGLDENLLLLPDTTVLNASRPLLTYEQYVDDAYDEYPELKMSHTETKLAEKNLKIIESDYLPKLSLRTANNLDRPILITLPPLDNFMNSWNVSLVLSYNLSSIYQNKHNVRAGKSAITFHHLQEELEKQGIRTGIKAAFIKHKEAIDRVNVLLISIRQANENYRIVQNRYFNQLAVLTDLLDATTVRLKTEMQLTEAKANVVYTYYQLLKSSGKI